MRFLISLKSYCRYLPLGRVRGFITNIHPQILYCVFMQWIYWLLAILLSLGAGYWVYRADKRRAVPYPWLTALLRSIVIFLTALLLLVPTLNIHKNETEQPVVLLLQDDSRSIGEALKSDSSAYRKDMEALLKKLSDKYHVVKWGFGAATRDDSLFQYNLPVTDIAAALQRAQEFYGQQNLGAVILATDGRFNQGAHPQFQSLALNAGLYTVALGDSAAAKDIRIGQVYANKTVALNSQFEVRADLIATRCNGYNNHVSLQEAGAGTLSTSPVSFNADQADRSVSFSVKADKPGLHHYIISLPPADGEQNIVNNRRDLFVEVVDEKKNILIATASPHPDINALREALEGLETYKVTVRTIDNLPTSLSDYQVVILHGLPSGGGSLPQQLLQSKKPVWYILGPQSNFSAIGQLQKTATLHINTAVQRDALPAYNTSFSGFTLPSDVAAVFDKMPPLSVPVGEIKSSPDAAVLLTQRTNAAPLWVVHSGNPSVALLMGEGIWRWRLYEYKNFNRHEVIDECIRQTVSMLAANTSERPFHVALPKYVWSDQEAIVLNAYLLNANNEQVNTTNVSITITDSAGRKQLFSFERSGSAYRLNIGVHAGGTYTYLAQAKYNDKTYTATGSFVVESIPLELMQTGADYPLLYALARKYNGAFVPRTQLASLYDSISANKNIHPLIRTNSETVPLVDWKWFFFLIIAFATGEWLLRKYWLAQ